MSKTMAEKILSNKSQTDARAGDLVVASVDAVVLTDTNGPSALKYFKELGGKKLYKPENVVLVMDHLAPCPTAAAANTHKTMYEFAEEFSAVVYEGGEGICHELMPENGHVLPGELVIGTDSHTTTYGAINAFGTGFGSTEAAVVMLTGQSWFRVPESIKIEITGKLSSGVYSKDLILKVMSLLGTDGANYKAIEFTGDTINELSIEARMTLSNMGVEAGAKVALIEADNKTIDWAKQTTSRTFSPVAPDKDASYVEHYQIDASQMVPLVSKPHSPGDVIPVTDIKNVKLNQVVIGYCTNGRMEDFRIAAQFIKGNKVARGTKLIICPASRKIYTQLMREGLLEVFNEAGALINPASCGVCAGYHSGVPADGDVILSTTNRNFMGRMGNNRADIYLCSPATAAASAIAGEIIDPRLTGLGGVGL